MAGAKVAELARRGIEAFVESEKKFLDLSHEVGAAIKGGKPTAKPRERMEVLTKLAREGAEKYIDAQKGLLELAIEELETAGKAKGERKVAIRKTPQQYWGELTEKGVKNLVAAEKSLLDLAIKPKRGMARGEIRKAGRRARAREYGKSPQDSRVENICCRLGPLPLAQRDLCQPYRGGDCVADNCRPRRASDGAVPEGRSNTTLETSRSYRLSLGCRSRVSHVRLKSIGVQLNHGGRSIYRSRRLEHVYHAALHSVA